MKIEQRKWTGASGGGPVSAKANDHSRLALVFGATALLRDPALLEAVKK